MAQPLGREPYSISSLSIVLPLHNESENLLPFLEKLLRVVEGDFPGGPVEVILVENGSTDGTPDLLSGIPGSFAGGRILVKKIVFHWADYSEAVRRGVLVAEGDAIVWLGVDIDDLGTIRRGLNALTDASVVILSKYKGADWRPFYRRLLNRTYIFLVRVFCQLWFSDIEGYLAIRKQVKPIFKFINFSRKNTLNLNLLFFCQRLKVPIGEVPLYVYEKRRSRVLKNAASLILYNFLALIEVRRRFGEFCRVNMARS